MPNPKTLTVEQVDGLRLHDEVMNMLCDSHEQLRADRDRWKAAAENAVKTSDIVRREAEELRKLVDAMMEYNIDHALLCAAVIKNGKCDCGLDELIAKARWEVAE